MSRWHVCCAALVTGAWPAFAGPPYFSDDPEPTEYGQFEIYVFGSAVSASDGTTGAAGIDFNYGATQDLQLTFVIPLAYENPTAGAAAAGLGNIELAAKYRFLHQESFGWDVSVFPRFFLPSGSSDVGEQHASFLLPIWVEKDWQSWSTFGGGGCVINRGGDSKDFCLAGRALTLQVLPDLQLGAEIFHQSADTKGGLAETGVGAGLRFDVNENFHVLAYAGRGIQNTEETNRLSLYSALLVTY